MKRTQSLVALLVALLLGVVLTSCSGSTTVDTSIVAPATAASALQDGAVAIDVRTPAEFASGHLTDALNIDVSAGDFESKVGQLDKSASYVVYCHSGNRAAQAMDKMADLGFTDMVNGGGFAQLAAAGLPVS